MYGIIYRAFNLINNKCYIGQTVHSLEARKRVHYSDFSNCTYFHRALKKYNKEDWEWSIIDTANSQKELNEKECYWIGYYQVFGKGYNLTSGGQGSSDVVITEEHKRKTRNTMLEVKDDNYKKYNKPINKLVRCIETNQVFQSMSEASRMMNIPYNKIQKACNNMNNIAGDYHWEVLSDEESLKYLPNAFYCVELNKIYVSFKQARKEDRFHEGNLNLAMKKGNPYEEKKYAGYTFYWLNPQLRGTP